MTADYFGARIVQTEGMDAYLNGRNNAINRILIVGSLLVEKICNE
jgi:hypothetical protein